MEKTKIAIIGGSGLTTFIAKIVEKRIKTPHGASPAITIGKIGDEKIAFLPRHGKRHDRPPHKINYRANMWALHSLGVERILATNAVGAINENYRPGELVIPSDFIDFTKNRSLTFYDDAPVTHIDMTEPYCPELRMVLEKATERGTQKTWSNAVYACMEGPRYETPAEIRMLKILGCDVVGMTGVPEATLARELEICYATVCFVSNMAAGIQKRISTEEVAEIGKKITPVLKRVLEEACTQIPEKRSCPCYRTLGRARF